MGVTTATHLRAVLTETTRQQLLIAGIEKLLGECQPNEVMTVACEGADMLLELSRFLSERAQVMYDLAIRAHKSAQLSSTPSGGQAQN